VDWLGRRSIAEQKAAVQLAEQHRAKDARNPGMALVQACGLRSLGEYGQCLDRMDEIDDYFQKLQILHMALRMQIEYLNDNQDELKSLANEATLLANEYQLIEPLLVRGWINIAQNELGAARNAVNAIRQIAPEYLEGNVLAAWETMLSSPRKAKDAVSLLRSAAIRKGVDDWFYHEALANALALSNNWNGASDQIDEAIRYAPVFMQSELAEERDAMVAKKLPKLDWDARLRKTWRLQP
jgi:hypothetical protein